MNTKRILAILLVGIICVGLFTSVQGAGMKSTNDMVTVATTAVPDEEIIFNNFDRYFISQLSSYYTYEVKKVYLSDKKDYILYTLSEGVLNILHWEGNGETAIAIPDVINENPVKEVVIKSDKGFKNVILADGIERFIFDEWDESDEYLPGYDSVSTIESFTLGKSFVGVPYCSWGTFDSLIAINVSDENENLKSIDGVLFTKDGKEILFYPPAKGSKYTLPNGTKTIAEQAFWGVTNLKKITLNKGLKKICDFAFAKDLYLKKVTIPASVKKIGYKAFYDCKKLQKVVLEGKKTKLTEDSGIIFKDDGDNFGEGRIVKKMIIKAPVGSTAKKLAKYKKIKFVTTKK